MEKYSLRRGNLIRAVDAFIEILIILKCSIKSIYIEQLWFMNSYVR